MLGFMEEQVADPCQGLQGPRDPSVFPTSMEMWGGPSVFGRCAAVFYTIYAQVTAPAEPIASGHHDEGCHVCAADGGPPRGKLEIVCHVGGTCWVSQVAAVEAVDEQTGQKRLVAPVA